MLILHSPLRNASETLTAWKHFESYVPHKIRSLGISNVNLAGLATLHRDALVKPSLVQNRFYGREKFDGPLRRFCKENGIVYQSFWTLTGNPELLKSDLVKEMAMSLEVSREVALYLLVMGLGEVSVLNGTTNLHRMSEDLKGLKTGNEWARRGRNAEEWSIFIQAFKKLVGD